MLGCIGFMMVLIGNQIQYWVQYSIATKYPAEWESAFGSRDAKVWMYSKNYRHFAMPILAADKELSGRQSFAKGLMGIGVVIFVITLLMYLIASL